VRDYNVHIREFPVNLTAMMFGYKQKPSFTVENEREIQEAPVVDFGGQASIAPVIAPGQAPLRSSTRAPQPIPLPESQNMKPGSQPAPPPSGG
jgi:LemA protein